MKIHDKDYYKTTDVNDGVAFATTSEEENKSHKKKVITYYKCENMGHYANECLEEETVKMSKKGIKSPMEDISRPIGGKQSRKIELLHHLVAKLLYLCKCT